MTRDAKDVLILGAGFSTAFDPEFPLTNRLGEMAYAELGIKIDGEPITFDARESFETVLSLLAEAKPYQDETEAFADQSLFLRLSGAVSGLMSHIQDRSFRTHKPPPWLYSLLSVCHQRRSTIVTFNYDTIIETGVESHHLEPDETRIVPQAPIGKSTPRESMSVVGATDLLQHLVPVIPSGESPARLVASMRLLKLHGSLDWWWSPGDVTGSSIVREGEYGVLGTPRRVSAQNRHDYLPSKSRFIVPPLATKSAYYQNPISKQLWRDAYEAIRSAQHVALIGYSLPIADAVTFAMLRKALHGRYMPLHIVNRDVDEMLPRVRALLNLPEDGPLPSWVETWNGDDAVEKYVNSFASEESVWMVDQLRENFAPPYPPDQMTLHVAWPAAGGPIPRKVGSITRDGRRLILETAPVPPRSSRRRAPVAQETDEKKATLASLLVAVDDGIDDVLVRHGDSAPVYPISLQMNTNWAKFTPACLIPHIEVD